MHHPDENDDELWSRVARHDERALEQLLRRYHQRLCEFAYSILKQRDQVEEAVSNVFLNVWRRRETLDIKTSVRSYLFAAVANQALTLRKRQLSRRTALMEEVPAQSLAVVQGADRELIYAELEQEVEEIIASLPPQRMIVFRMNRFEGLRYLEIARALGLSERTVQNHMVLAIKHLAKELPRLRLH